MPTTESHPPDDKNPNLDTSIAYNGAISMILSLCFFLTFIVFRRRAKWVYMPNALLIPNHPVLDPPSRKNLNGDLSTSGRVFNSSSGNFVPISPILSAVDNDWMDQYFGPRRDPPRSKAPFGWLWYVLLLPDTTLLTLVGMDGFIFLMTLKFLFTVMLWLAIFGFLVLIPVYSIGSLPASQLYMEFSIRHLGNASGWFWIPFLFTYGFSIYLLYAMFVFYNSYMHLRQAYLAHPASLTSIYEVIRFYEATGSLETAYSYMNLPSRTILIEGLDRKKFQTEEDVVVFMQQCGIGKIKEAIFIRDHRDLRISIRKRNQVLRKLEKAIMTLLKNLLLDIRKNQQNPNVRSTLPLCLRNIRLETLLEKEVLPIHEEEGEDNEDEESASTSVNILMEDTGDLECSKDLYRDNISDDPHYIFSAGEKASLLQFALSESFMPSYRPHHRVKPPLDAQHEESLLSMDGIGDSVKSLWEARVTVDSISYYYRLLKILDLEIERERLRFIEESLHQQGNPPESAPPATQSEPALEFQSKLKDVPAVHPRSLKPVAEEALFEDHANFINVVLGASGLFDDMKLLYPRACKSAFVTFDESITASMARQALLDSALFGIRARSAPQSREVHWENLAESTVLLNLRYYAVVILFIILNLLYSFPVSFIFSLNNIQAVVRIFPFLGFIKNLPKSFQAIIEGSIAPMLLNILLVIIPFALMGLTRLQGYKSETEVQSSLLRKYIVFLFLQTFLVTFLSGTLLDSLKPIAEGEEVGDFLNRITDSIKHTLANRSSFYFNLMVIRIATGLFLTLVDPIGLFSYLIRKSLRITNETPREKQELRSHAHVSYGLVYPQLLFPLPLILTYSVLSPLILMVGCFYYGFAYFIYRYEFIYKLQTPCERGGEPYWHQTAQFLTISIVTFQVMTALQLSVQHATFEATLLLPLIIITIYVAVQMQRAYKTRLKYIPLAQRADLQQKGLGAKKELHGEAFVAKFNNFSHLLHISKFLSRQKNLLGVILLHRESSRRQLDAQMNDEKDGVFNCVSMATGDEGELVTGMTHSVEALNVSGVDNNIDSDDLDIPDAAAIGSISTPLLSKGRHVHTNLSWHWFLSNPYRNPTLFKKLQHIFLPRTFYKVVKIVKESESDSSSRV